LSEARIDCACASSLVPEAFVVLEACRFALAAAYTATAAALAATACALATGASATTEPAFVALAGIGTGSALTSAGTTSATTRMSVSAAMSRVDVADRYMVRVLPVRAGDEKPGSLLEGRVAFGRARPHHADVRSFTFGSPAVMGGVSPSGRPVTLRPPLSRGVPFRGEAAFASLMSNAVHT
jgi:hypothetical protein